VSDPKIVASAKNQERSRPVPQDSRRSWLILGWIGLAFLIVGGTDFLLAWVPPNFGTREWEYATVTQSFNGLPILLLGVGLLTVASEAVGRRWWGLVALGASAVLLFWVLAGAALWAMSIGLALETAPEQVLIGVQRGAVRTVVQILAYVPALAYLLGRAFRPRRVDEAGT
jgi:hypothetical protein